MVEKRVGLVFDQSEKFRRYNYCTRAVEITYNVILYQDQVQAIYFDLRSDQGQIIFVILRKFKDQDQDQFNIFLLRF